MSTYDEIVPDSEPEREQLRRTRKARKSTEKKRTETLSSRDLNIVPQPPDLIEISDNSSSPVEVQFRPLSSLLDLSKDNPPVLQSQTEPNPSASIISLSDDSESDSGAPRLHISQFAFKQASTYRRSPTVQNAPSTSNATSSLPKLLPRKPSRTASHRFVDDFTEVDLSQLAKCVSCDTRWTTRKATTPKMLHIQTCAKKKGWTDDTVRVLIRRELDKGKNSDAQPQAVMRKSTLPVPSVTHTLLEEVVRDDEAKKRGKRLEVLKTVMQPGDSRPDILSRARSLLGGSAASLPVSTPSESDNGPPPATQEFAPSRVGGLNTPLVAAFGAPVSHISIQSGSDSPPQTQAFATSRFGQSTLSREFPWVDSSETNRQHASNPPFSSSGEYHPSVSTSNNPVNHSSWSNQGPESPVLYDENFEWQNDDAILHFEPEVENTTRISNPQPSHSKSPITSSTSLSIQPVTTNSRKGKEKASTKSKRGETVTLPEDSNEELDLQLLRIIRNYKELHLRILRYESISFDEFMQLATANGIPSRGLKPKIIAFLDKQAINFHGAHARAGRTKRR